MLVELVIKAIGLSKSFESTITLIHVLPQTINDKKVRDLVEEAASLKLKELETFINNEGVKTEPSILTHGNSFDKIVEASETLNSNLIFISAGDKPKEDVFQLGSTSESIVRNSNHPVWVSKNASGVKISNIICPVDFSAESARALKNSIILARRINAKLTIFSVYERVYTGANTFDIDWAEYNKKAKEAHFKEFDLFLERFNLTNLNWEKQTASGKPHVQILVAIKRLNADLLIIGTSGKSGLSRLVLGSVTEKVIREVPCSFVTLKKEDIINLKTESRINDLEASYIEALELKDSGFLQESVVKFRNCLRINDMHIPSLNGIAKVFDLIGDERQATSYRNRLKEVYNRVWDMKIEDEIRRNFSV